MNVRSRLVSLFVFLVWLGHPVMAHCCQDDPEVIFNWTGDDGAPIGAYFTSTGFITGPPIGITIQAGHGIHGDAALHSDHATLAGRVAEMYLIFDAAGNPVGAAGNSTTIGSDLDVCGNIRREFTVGGYWNFINTYDEANLMLEISNVEGPFFSIAQESAGGGPGIGPGGPGMSNDITIFNGDTNEIVYYVTNAIKPGTFRKYEFRGAISSYDADGNAQNDAWIEMRIDGHVIPTGTDYNLFDPGAPPSRCPVEQPKITNAGPITNPDLQGWDRIKIATQGDATCLYVKDVANYCNFEDQPPEAGPKAECQAPGPGGSSFDGSPQGPRIVADGGFPVTAADYVAPTPGGISATASDPTNPQSLVGLTTPLFSFDITLTNGAVRRASQAGSLPSPGRAPATWQILRVSPIEYIRSDRFGNIKAQNWTLDIADPDGSVRSDLDATATRTYRRWQAQGFCESDTARLAGTARQPVVRGRCVSANTDTAQVVTLAFSDEFSYPQSQVALQRKLPLYTIGDLFRTGVTATGVIFTGDAPEANLQKALPIIFGEASDERRLISGDATTVLTIPVGIVKVIDIGDVLLAGGSETWRGFAICQYASKAFKSAFGSNLNPDCPASVRLDPDLFSTELLVPDLGNWSSYFSTPYFDLAYNGITVRVTMMFARGPRADQHVKGTVPFSVNVWGKEDVGDGSGTLITDGAQIVQALFHWPILQSAKLGNEALPTFSDGVAKFRTSSAVAATTIHQGRLSTGYPGVLIIDDFQPASQWLGGALVSYDLRFHINEHGQAVITTLDDAQSLTGLSAYTAQKHVRGDTFKTTSERSSELENARPFDYGPEPATGRTTQPLAVKSVQTSIDAWDANSVPYKGDDLHLIGVYERPVALDVVARSLNLTKDGRTLGEFSSDLDLFANRPGDLIRLTDFRGLGSSGWTERVLLVDGMVLNPNVSNPPQEDDLGITIQWEDMHQNLVAPVGMVGGGTTSDGSTTSAVGFNPLGSSAGHTGWVLGSSASGTGWRLG